jgi:hypothetical protein
MVSAWMFIRQRSRRPSSMPGDRRFRSAQWHFEVSYLPFSSPFGLLFAGFTWLMGGPILFIGPAVAVITLLNLRLVKFCDRCERTIDASNFSVARFCPRCGAELK